MQCLLGDGKGQTAGVGTSWCLEFLLGAPVLESQPASYNSPAPLGRARLYVVFVIVPVCYCSSAFYVSFKSAFQGGVTLPTHRLTAVVQRKVVRADLEQHSLLQGLCGEKNQDASVISVCTPLASVLITTGINVF